MYSVLNYNRRHNATYAHHVERDPALCGSPLTLVTSRLPILTPLLSYSKTVTLECDLETIKGVCRKHCS